MKISTIIVIVLFLSVKANSQEKVVLYYNENWEITKKEKATYFREAEFDMEKFLINGQVSDFKISGDKVMTGNYTNGKRNGEFTFFYANGNIERKGCYLNNRRTGKWEYFYPNGNLKQLVIFYPKMIADDIVVVDFFDREGKQWIKNGTGKWVVDSIRSGLFENINLKRLTGQFKDSLKVGEWKLVRIDNGKLVHSEKFVNGKFVGAVVFSPASQEYGTASSEMMPKLSEDQQLKFIHTESFDLDTTVFSSSILSADVVTIFKILTGKEFEIRNRKVMYPEGDYSLMEFIAQNIRYPGSALEGKISGKVYIGAYIDAKGNLKEAKILYGMHKDLDNEALRVIRLITKWVPAIHEGTPVESTLTIPVTFELRE